MKSKVIPILFIVLVVLIGAAAYLYQQVATLQSDPEALARQEAEALVAEVSKVILLPQGEVPTVATVSDPTALADQAFFAKAKVGDKVLLYPQARKAYLYDPSAKKVLEVAPINLGDVGNVSPQPAPEVEEEPVPEADASAEVDAEATTEETPEQ